MDLLESPKISKACAALAPQKANSIRFFIVYWSVEFDRLKFGLDGYLGDSLVSDFVENRDCEVEVGRFFADY